MLFVYLWNGLLPLHPYLTHFHSLQRRFMACGRHAGTAGGVHGQRHLGKCGLDKHGIGDDADIGTKADEGDALPRRGFVCLGQKLGQGK